jgi:hypothetical protein
VLKKVDPIKAGSGISSPGPAYYRANSNKDNTMERTDVFNITSTNTRIIGFKYLGPTNTRGSRIKLTDKRFERSKTIPYDYRYTSAVEGAAAYLIENGWRVVGSNSDHGVLIIGDFDSDLQL